MASGPYQRSFMNTMPDGVPKSKETGQDEAIGRVEEADTIPLIAGRQCHTILRFTVPMAK